MNSNKKYWRKLGMMAYLIMGLTLGGRAQVQVTTRVSVSSNGIEGNWGGGGAPPAISSDGRFVAFSSFATNLVPGDTNGQNDIFVHDRTTGTVEMISLGMAGQPADGWSIYCDISADGRFVVFDSWASNIVPGDVNAAPDVFVYDRLLGATECASVDPFGLPSNGGSTHPKISADGNFVCFDSWSSNIDFSDSNFKADIFVYDRIARVVERVNLDDLGTEANAKSLLPDISADGRFVAYESWASNLVSGDTNNAVDYFVRDRLLWTTERVSIDSNGSQGLPGSIMSVDSGDPGISGDGRYVVFVSVMSNLVPGDTNGREDVFLRDRSLGITERVNVSSSGEEASYSTQSQQIMPEVSDDGRYVVYSSVAANLTSYDVYLGPDVFVRDRVKGVTELVSINSDAVQGNGVSSVASITPDGRYIAFSSLADNLVPGDTNNFSDVFVHDRMTGGPDVDLTNVVAGQTATLSITGATPGGIVVLGASLLGQGLLPTAWGPLELNGVSVFFAYVMDGAGQVSVPIWLDPALLGLPLWVQGIDLTMDFPTSVWGGTIQ